jgi:hypothetical protein
MWLNVLGRYAPVPAHQIAQAAIEKICSAILNHRIQYRTSQNLITLMVKRWPNLKVSRD